MSFLYFAYGSNMLTKRIHINCPSATKKCIAKLKNFKFTFNGYSDSWKGATANIVESPDDDVWGVVWEVAKEQEEKLERQEAGYMPIHVNVEDENGSQLLCKCFQKLSATDGVYLPSKIYKGVIVIGAEQHKLPPEYVKHLETFEINDYTGKVDIQVNV